MRTHRSPPAKRVRSAKLLIRHLLELNSSQDVLDAHLNELLGVLIWKITEAHGKHNLEYATEAALRATHKAKIVHEHVWERAKLVQAIRSNPSKLTKLLNNAVACLVTTAEHRRLSKVAPSLQGWARYEAAGIKVLKIKRRGNAGKNGM